MSSYFLLIFPLGFYRSFSDISLYIASHIFPEKVFGEVIYMSYLQYFSPLGFLMGYQWHSDLFKSHSYMLFSPYFSIRFKGTFIAYLYIHIPHIFPEKVFGEVVYMSYLQYFSPLGFLMGYQWHSDLFKSHSYMLFSPYFSIRFKGVFIAYLYIHIPQIFFTWFFKESKHTAALILKNIR